MVGQANRTWKILVVDDTPQNIRVLEAILVARGYTVLTAHSGSEALDEVRHDLPDLVLLDVIMPGLSGYDVARQLRASAATRFLPIVMVTALQAQEERVKALEAGADDFLTKPINQVELLARVQSLLRIKAYHDTIQDQARRLAEWNKTLEQRVQQQVEEIQVARERLVTAREEERRRLRRDLHDGLGPTLASLFQRLDSALRLVHPDPHGATALLADVKTQVRSVIADIRRLVYALRPPTLDEFGLVGALREHASQLNADKAVRVTISAPDSLPPLPAAVEVAAYRIAVESLTNVFRHAQASECSVTLRLADGLWIEVGDNGVGLPAGAHAGVGLTAVRERAAELGGEVRVAAGAEGGTTITARLPLATAGE